MKWWDISHHWELRLLDSRALLFWLMISLKAFPSTFFLACKWFQPFLLTLQYFTCLEKCLILASNRTPITPLGSVQTREDLFPTNSKILSLDLNQFRFK
jgi:hypothetical protein